MGASAGVIAAAAARARRELLEHFRVAGATRPETATALPDVRPVAARQLAKLERAGVVRAAPGGYWLDEAAYAVHAAGRRRRVVIALLVVLAVQAVVAGGVLIGSRIGAQ